MLGHRSKANGRWKDAVGVRQFYDQTSCSAFIRTRVYTIVVVALDAAIKEQVQRLRELQAISLAT